MEFSFKTRRQNIESLRATSPAEIFDLVIVGGGITGAGIARDAVSRGMKVALIEANDFAVGTSSRSSKLIHGGIRYLENFEFGLVFEALSERSRLFEMAPHLVHPLRFLLPVYDYSRVGMFKLGMGMWAYDALALFQAPEMHERLNKLQSLERVPMLNQDELCGSYVYSDAYMDDDRLVIETLRSAHEWGAVAVNYVKAKSAEYENGRVIKINCVDQLSGQTFAVQGRHFVSAVGPWTDIWGQTLFPDWQKIMRPSKGVHLTFSRSRLKLDEAVVMVSDDEKRIVFAIPRHEMIIIGTTDTDFPQDPGEVRTTREDVEYLLAIAEKYFPGAKLKENDILASYSGVRPLVDDGSVSESKTSREHVIISDPRNVTFVSGGKYTTYRKMAADTLKVILENFSPEERMQFQNSQTELPLNPLATRETLLRAQLQIEERAERYELDVDTVNFLVERHGEEAWEIIEKHFGGAESFELPPMWKLEAGHAIHGTMCLTLLDFYLRRSALFLAHSDHGFKLVDHLANFFAAQLGLSKEERQRQINALQQHLDTEMGWRNE